MSIRMDYTEKIKARSNPKDAFETPPKDQRIIDTVLDSSEKPPVAKQEKNVSKRQLVGRLNRINFQDQTLSLNFEHLKDKRIVSLQGKPQPCFGKKLICLWAEKPDIKRLLSLYRFRDFTFNHNARGVIAVNASLVGASEKGICLSLPETAVQTTARRAQRHACSDLSVRVIQNSVVYNGTLIDFSPYAFHVEITSLPGKPFQWINPKNKINLVISAEEEVLYTQECGILKQTGGTEKENIILEPLNDTIQRFAPKKYRSERVKLIPSPDILFEHPFTRRSVNLKVIDISGSGVCVEDDEESSVLLSGMIIPSMTLAFATNLFFKCKAQVVYRKPSPADSPKKPFRCGIAFLDMSPNDHMRLLSILHQTENKNIYICAEIDMDDLWAFFFKSGFLYPKKYAFIQKNKVEIKKTYERLYKSDSTIARHLTWQKRGVILGHLSLLRFYENTWLIHHLAAVRSDEQIRIGIEILKHVGSFAYDCHKLYANHMNYLICYYRPDNKFPNYFFGGVAQNIQNPKACSVDAFAYLHFRKSSDYKTAPDDSWKLVKSEYEDMVALESFYERESGGVMIGALDLTPDENMAQRHELADAYKKINLTRKRLIYSLKQDKFLKAVMMVNVSDVALNLSDLTRSITVFVLDPEDLTADRLLWAVSVLSSEYTTNKFPVLIYPIAYADTQSVLYEKTYNLWALTRGYSDDYFKNLESLLTDLTQTNA